MKTRERLKKISEAKGPLHKLFLACDNDPGTDFDSTFSKMETCWWVMHGNEPEAIKTVHSPTFRAALQRTDDEPKSKSVTGMRRHELALGKVHSFVAEPNVKDLVAGYYKDLGRDLADGCVRYGSQWLRMMADALDAWNDHQPQEDKLRSELLWISSSSKSPTSMRRIRQILAERGIKVISETDRKGEGVSERQIRKLAPSLGLRIEGKPGRPKTRKP